jgi:Transposase DDE domain
LGVLDGHELDGPLAQAGDLLGLVAGQDVAAGEDGVFRIVRRVARDRLISTVDVQARHGHKSRARTFDGYKSHFAIDPEDELITAVVLTPANTPDRDVVDELLDEPCTGEPTGDTAAVPNDSAVDSGDDGQGRPGAKDIEVYGDSAYAGGATLEEQAARGRDMRTKVPPVRNPNGYSKDHFTIDLVAGTVTRPADHSVSIGKGARHRTARFGALCASCPLRAQCTKARRGRVISIHPHEAALLTLGRPKSPLPRPETHPDRHPDPSQRHQPRPTGHPGPAPRTHRLGHRLTPAPRGPQRRTFRTPPSVENRTPSTSAPSRATTSAAS